MPFFRLLLVFAATTMIISCQNNRNNSKGPIEKKVAPQSINDWAEKIVEIEAPTKSKTQHVGFFKTSTIEQDRKVLSNLKTLRLELDQVDPLTMDDFGQSALRSLKAYIDNKVWEQETCENIYFDNSFKWGVVTNFVWEASKKMDKEPTRLAPVLAMLPLFTKQLANFEDRLKTMIKDGAFPGKNLIDIDETIFSVETFKESYKNSYSGLSNFDWENCIDCEMSKEQFFKLIDTNIIDETLRVLKFYQTEITPKAHNNTYNESIKAHTSCTQAWFEFYTESKILSPMELKQQVLEELQITEKRMYDLIVEINPISSGAKTPEEITASIKRFSVTWAEKTETAKSEEELKVKMTEAFDKYLAIENQVIDYEIPPTKINSIFEDYREHVGGGYSPDPKNPTSTIVAGPKTPLALIYPVLFHEASPGHHLQFAFIHQLEIHDLLKWGVTSSAFEGWGLYSEQLSDELGLYNGNEGRLAQLDLLRVRLIRVINILRLHFEGQSKEDAEKFMVTHTFPYNLNPQSELGRQIGWRGRDMGYYLGFKKIMALREKAKTQLGEKFRLQDFHQAILEHGHSTMKTFEVQVEKYIKKAQQK